MENPSEKLLEVNLRCPWWELCDSRRCWACVQACTERRAAAREAALERLFDAMEEQWEQEALDYWL